MNRIPKSDNHPPRVARDVPLVIKDGLREIRFSTKQSAKRWMDGIEDVLSDIPRLGPPLGAATKTVSQLLQLADRTAVDLLSTESAFRRANFRLPPPDFYVTDGDDPTNSKLFIKNHYWALKHLLKLKDKVDFLVHEESIFQALRIFREAQDTNTRLPGFALPSQARVSESSLLSARVISALYSSKPLSHHDGASQHPDVLAESTATLTLHACVSVVLASEITSFSPNVSAQIETLEALKRADEVCGARLEAWEVAILHRHPLQELARELDFSLRHL